MMRRGYTPHPGNLAGYWRNGMRISTAFQFDSFTRDISEAQQRVFDTQKQMTTGKRVNKPSDDPFAASSIIRINSLQAGITQYKANLSTAKSTLNFSSQALSDINTLMTSAYTQALQAGTDTMSQTARQAMAAGIGDLQTRLVSLANSRGADGNYLFAGQKNNAAPYSAAAGTITYSGDANNVSIEVSPTESVVVNTQSQTLITNAYNALESLRQNMLNGNVSAISNDITSIQSSRDAVTQANGYAGTKLQTVTNLLSQHERRAEELTSSLSDVQDVDMAQAIMDYRSANSAYEAAMTVAAQGFQLSLMDYIK